MDPRGDGQGADRWTRTATLELSNDAVVAAASDAFVQAGAGA